MATQDDHADELRERRRDAIASAREAREEFVASTREKRREALAAARQRPSERRTSSRGTRTSLTLEAILARATRILDADGTEGLTIRRLASELGAGAASVYWHVDDKDELLRLAYEAVAGPPVREALERPIDPSHWREGVRTAALAIFAVFEAHPWVVELMAGEQRGEIVILAWDRFGQLLTTLGLSDEAAFDAGTALMGVFGVAGLGAVNNARSTDDRDARLSRAAGEFASLDPAEFPFVSRTLSTYRRHSEREQFLGGLEFVMDGIEARLAAQRGRR
ncbi:MAG: TetR/AcrR family transcriptional regulator [Propionicimonas sp.]|uniref:TetR/AcrR family transcriptional regulator n=1 Tax=Propionicimonas sp. TaxID=1955623 RepID=UPI003D0E8976